MEINIAISIAIEALTRAQHQYAFDASLARRGIDSMFAARALKRWDKLEKAKEVLKQWKSS